MIRLLTILAILTTAAIAAADDDGRQPYDVLGPQEVPPPPPPPPQEGYDAGEQVAPVVEIHVPIPPPPPRPLHPGFALHLNIAAEILGGSSAGQSMTSFMARMRAGFTNPIGSGRVRPIIGFGAIAGIGVINVEERRGLDGTVDLGHFDYGPEIQVGLRFVNGGHVDTRLYATLAYLRTNLDKRLEIDAIPGVGGREGIRASLGINFADRIGVIMVETPSTTRRHGKSSGAWALAMVPQQIEVAWERSAGSDRVGAAFGWGI